MQVRAEFLAEALEQAWDEIQVELGTPCILDRGVLFGGLVIHFAAPDAIDSVETGHAALCTKGFVAELGMLGDGGDCVVDIFAAGVTVHEDSVTRRAAEQLVDGNVEGFALDVPERGIDRGYRRHGDRTAAPVRTFVEIMPSVFDAPRVAADENRDYVIGEIAGDGEFAAVKRGVTETVEAVFGRDF